MITLVKDTIDNNDIDRLIDWLKTYPRLTKGPVTLELESKYSDWLGREYSVFCNSGSSANLLMLSALQQGKYLKNDKIVVPSVAWATDLAPVMQLGLKPILCDSNKRDLSADLVHLEKIFKEENGHANPSKRHPSIGTWVIRQRAAFRNKKLSQKRIEMLERFKGWIWSYEN